jgi:hypothetical protein
MRRRRRLRRACRTWRTRWRRRLQAAVLLRVHDRRCRKVEHELDVSEDEELILASKYLHSLDDVAVVACKTHGARLLQRSVRSRAAQRWAVGNFRLVVGFETIASKRRRRMRRRRRRPRRRRRRTGWSARRLPNVGDRRVVLRDGQRTGLVQNEDWQLRERVDQAHDGRARGFLEARRDGFVSRLGFVVDHLPRAAQRLRCAHEATVDWRWLRRALRGRR